jgi:threonine dehydratase
MTSPFAISFADVQSAAERLRGVANLTPVHTSRRLNERTSREVFVKCENFQRTGSFKFRGAYNAISRLSDAQRKRGVVTYSSGNHAQAVALTAKLFDAPAIIVMPHDAPQIKVSAVQAYGAQVVSYQRGVEDRVAIGNAIAQERSMSVVPPFDHPQVMAGQGTLMIEWLSQAPDMDAVIVPMGGGGLMAGCAVAAKAIKPSIRIFGAEPADADDHKRSFVADTRVKLERDPQTIADGVRTLQPGELTFPINRALVEDVLVVSDEAIMRALSVLVLQMKLVSEPTGALALAALLEGNLPRECKRVGVLLCGGNVEPEVLAKLS